MICDNEQLAQETRYALISKVTYDSFGDLLFGASVLGPFNLNEMMASVLSLDIVEKPKPKLPDPVTAGDFKINGAVVTVIQNKDVLTSIIDKIDDVVTKSLNEEHIMRAKLKKLNLPANVIDAMISAKNTEKK